MNKYQEAVERKQAKDLELAEIFKAHPDLDMSIEEVERVQSLEKELKDLQGEVQKYAYLNEIGERTAEALKASQTPIRTIPFASDGNNVVNAPAAKTIGDLFVESAAYKNIVGKHARGDKNVFAKDDIAGIDVKRYLGLETKTDMTTAAGWAPQSIRADKVVFSAQRIPNVADILPKITTSQAAYVYMEETTFTNNVAAAAENAALGESAFVLTERTRTMRKIGGSIPVTYEQLEDVEGIREYLNNRMTLQVAQSLETQLLTATGDGNAPNFNSFATDVTQAQAKGTDPTPDAVYKAMVLVRNTGRAVPDHIIIDPSDWQDIRLLRTADGVYIYGSPQDPGVERMWGLPVLQSTEQADGTALVGDFSNYSLLVMRQGLQFETTNSHASEFLDNVLRIKCWIRGALVVLRPAAFCEVTGI